jgi:hypothetical protein
MPDRTLLALFAEIRGALLRQLQHVDPAAVHFTPPGLSNHILWHAGHAYVVVEWLTMGALGLEPVAPPGWFELFSWDSKPADIPADKFPPLAEVVKQLQLQHQRLTTMFASLGELDLRNAAVDQPEQSVREIIVHALQDEASHKGEIWLLRKLFVLQSKSSP